VGCAWVWDIKHGVVRGQLEQFPGRGGQRRLEGFGNLAELDWWRSRSGGSAAVRPESVLAEFKLRFRNLTSVSSVI